MPAFFCSFFFVDSRHNKEMQDFDFGKHYRSNQRETGAIEKGHPTRSSFRSKIIFLASILSVAYLAGIFTGIYVNDHKVVQAGELEHLANNSEGNVVADIHPNNTQNTDTQNNENRLTQELESDSTQFLILAKIYHMVMFCVETTCTKLCIALCNCEDIFSH